MSTSTTQQFDGATIEEALTAAVATMGDDLEILDAQKVLRRRRFGVRREERFEVVAAARPQSDDEFESVLRRMVDRVDDEERRVVDLRVPRNGGVDLADSDMSWWEGAEFVVPQSPTPAPARRRPVADVDLTGEIDVRDRSPRTPARPTARPDAVSPAPAAEAVVPAPAPAPAPAAEAEAVRPAPAPAPAPAVPLGATAPVAVTAPVTVAAPATPAPERPAPRRARPAHAAAPAPRAVPSLVDGTDDHVGWSADALGDLGLPPLVIERVAAMAPASDLEWVASLAAALTDLLHAVDAERSTVELTGYGRHAAVELISGICRGMRAGHLVIDGVRIPATPLELALGVRSCLQG